VLKPEFQIYATFTPHGVFKTFLYSGINKYWYMRLTLLYSFIGFGCWEPAKF
jgi:hypothetical protein